MGRARRSVASPGDDMPLVPRAGAPAGRQGLGRPGRAGLRIRPIQVRPRGPRLATSGGEVGVEVVSAAEFGASTRSMPSSIVDCQRRLTETLVCLREQRSRRIVGAALDLIRRGPVSRAG